MTIYRQRPLELGPPNLRVPNVWPSRPRPPDRSRWHWLLWLPVVLPLVTPLYNRADPKLFGLPFFYWSQLAFVGLEIIVITVVYQATKRATKRATKAGL
jgi:Protein of unknown function (DUF3311)